MKKTNNKGFSLVELIVVVAIMAVLMVVLAPQLLRYVERSRLQRDNSAIAEIANVIEIALADEAINADTPNGTTVTIVNAANTNAEVEFANDIAGATGTLLADELEAAIGDTYTTSSTTYNESDANIVLTITKANGQTTISVTEGWIAEVGGTATTAADAADDVVF